MIAVVDDDTSFLRSIGRLLRSVGYAVKTFGSAREFLASLPEPSPQCVVLDIHMPEMTGFERWGTFLRNHRAIAGMDLFTVPTATMNVLYAFFVIHQDRRRILHFNATYQPTAQWVIQQLREAFPFDSAPRHLIFDRDSIFCPAVAEFVKALGAEPSRTAHWSPW